MPPRKHGSLLRDDGQDAAESPGTLGYSCCYLDNAGKVAGHMWLTTLSRTPRLKCPTKPPPQSVWLPAPLRWPCARLRLQNLVHLDMFSGARSLQRMYCPTLTTMAMLAANSHVIKVITVCGTEVKLDSGGSAEASI